MADSVVEAALAHYRAGNTDAAIELLLGAIDADPSSALYHYHLGNVYWDQELRSEAASCYTEARRLDPNIAAIPFQTGVEFARAGMLDEAEACLSLALSFRNEHAPALSCLGDVLRRLGRPDEGLPLLEAAVRLAPSSSEAHANLGVAMCDMDRLEEATAALETALRLNPSDAAAMNNLGVAHRQRGQIDEARRILDAAVWLAPDFAEARLNRAMTMLLAGDFKESWFEYEWRPKAELPCEHPLRLPVAGKTILLHAEQGLGDLIQFVRYAGPLAKMGARVLVECGDAVAPLIRTASGIADVVVQGSTLPEFDENAPLLSLPRLLHPDAATLPVEFPYLRPDGELVAEWRKRFKDESRLRVGFVWGGNPGTSYDRRRSIPLVELGSILGEPGVAAYSLQRGPRMEELATLPASLSIVNLEATCSGIMDTAAAMMCVDLFITADTMPAHLAGALGRTVWILLPFAPDWRWMLGREDSAWYPTARLFRQPQPGDWSSVVRQAGDALRVALS